MSDLQPSNIQPTTFWQNKRVIVTGGGGFLGSFVIEKLKQRGANDIFIPIDHLGWVIKTRSQNSGTSGFIQHRQIMSGESDVSK